MEVSANGGDTWARAHLGRDHGRFSFREFALDVPTTGPGSMVVMARATSRLGETQTESLVHNPAGYHHNVMQRLYLEMVYEEAPSMRTLIGVAVVAIALAASAQEPKVQLKEGPGRDKVNACFTCHSVDYIEMNSRFMNKAAWTASVNKMINAFAAPIDKADVEVIATYLARNYGTQD